MVAIVAAGIVFGLAGLVFATVTHRLGTLAKRWIGYPPLGPLLGIVVATVAVDGYCYIGLGHSPQPRTAGRVRLRGDADAYRARLYGWLRTARTGDVLMCHPSAALFADPHAHARMREYAVLRAIDFPWHGDTCHVRPVPLTELLQRGADVP